MGATVLMEGTSLSAVTGADGSYTISSVPDPVTYTVEAQAVGFESATIARLTVDGSVDDVDFTLTPKSDDDGGGPPPCKGKNKNDQGC